MADSSELHRVVVAGGARLPAAAGVCPAGTSSRATNTSGSTANPSTTQSSSGDAWPRGSIGLRSGTRCSNGSTPTPSGSSAGKLNASYVCLDAQIERGLGDKAAILWEGEPESGRPGSGGSVHRISYRQLRDDVCRFANGLKKLGVKKGDRVTIYMPMVPEAAIAMLACARLGAAHSVIFGGFSSQAIADRVEDAKSTSHHHRRRRIPPRQRRAAQGQC